MLHELERKLAEVVADAVQDRAHLTVTVDSSSDGELATGRATARVAVIAGEPHQGFDRGRTAFGPGPTSRRVLPVSFTARIAFALRPDEQSPAAARALLLEDVSRVSHALDADDIRTGAALTTAMDAGFVVQSLVLLGLDLDPRRIHQDAPALAAEGVHQAEILCHGAALLWPPETIEPEGVTEAVDVVLAVTPIALIADDPVLRSGGSTSIRVRGVAGSRLVDDEAGDRDRLGLVIAVVGDAPPDQRGRILGGQEGPFAGSRLVAVRGPETVVTYEAPTEDSSSRRVEHVEVRLSTRQGQAGLLLGSVAVRVEPAP